MKENYKIPVGEIKEDMNKDAIYWEAILERPNSIKIASLHINVMQCKWKPLKKVLDFDKVVRKIGQKDTTTVDLFFKTFKQVIKTIWYLIFKCYRKY